MSDEDKPLEFSARDLMPAWAQDTPSSPEKTYAKRFENEEGEGDRRGGGRRDDRRGGGFAGRGGQGGGGGARDDRRGPRPEGRGGDRGRDRRGGDRGGDRRNGPDRDFRDRPREDLPAVGISAVIEPSKPAIEGLTKHIKETLRAFPLADLAKMILTARERYQVRFSAQDERRLYRCPADGSVWLSREEAIAHLLNGPAIEKFYVAEDVEMGAPSGNFNVVAVCGLSGTILGPPNHHEYQRNIVRLHQERFANMSLERFKSRIQMESGEEAIERWKDQVSRVRHYRLKSDLVVIEKKEEAAVEPAEETTVEEVESETAVEAPEEISAAVESVEEVITVEAAPELEEEAHADEAEAEVESEELVEEVIEDSVEAAKPAVEGLVIKSVEELARHFRQHYADKAVREVKEAVVPGDIPGRLLSSGLLAHLRQEGERLRRGFPLDLIQTLCRDLEKKGLKFFKRGRKALHVAAVRPREIDPAVTLTDQIRQIVDFVIASPRTTVAGMLEALVPDFKMPEKGVEAAVELSEDSKTVLKNLRWLTSEGYVLEFPDTSLTIGREPQKGDKAAPATAKKKESPKKKKASTPKEAAEPSPEAEVSPAQTDEGDDSSDPVLEIDAKDEDSSGVDELPESVDQVETL